MWGGRDELPLEGNGKASAIKVGQMTLSLFRLRRSSWAAICRNVSKLRKLQTLRLEGGLAASRKETLAMEQISHMTQLQCLFLGPHREAQLDITHRIADLLKYGVLEILRVDGRAYDIDDVGDENFCTSYSIDMDEICHSLKCNKTLHTLQLKFVQVEGSLVTKSLLGVLRDFNNTTLRDIDVHSYTHYFTINHGNPLDTFDMIDGSGGYDCYTYAQQLGFLARFNRYGRGKIQDKDTTLSGFVELLVGSSPRLGGVGEESEFNQKLLRIAANGGVDDLFELLAESPELWCCAVDLHLEQASMDYCMLRESPGLWCSCMDRPTARVPAVVKERGARKRKRGNVHGLKETPKSDTCTTAQAPTTQRR